MFDSKPIVRLVVVFVVAMFSQVSFGQIEWGGVNGDWSDGPNWASGNVPNHSGESALLGGSGGYNVNFDAAYTIGGLDITNTSAALTLNTGGTNPGARWLIVNNDVSNVGTVNINNTSDFFFSIFDVNGVFTNASSGNLTFGGTSSVEDPLRRMAASEFLNNGAVTVNQDAEFRKPGALVNNNGSFHVSAGKSLAMYVPTFNHNGTITNNGTLEFFSSEFNFNGGSASGNAVDLTSTTLNIGAGSVGAGTFDIRGANPMTRLSGDIAAAQTVNIIALGHIGSFVHHDNNSTIHGTLNLNADSVRNVTLAGSGTITTSATGTIQFGGTDVGAIRTLTADVVNNGTFDVNQNALVTKTGGVFTNNNSINIASGKELEFRIPTVNQNGGTFHNGGVVDLLSGTFNFNGGNISGNAIDLNSSQLNLGAGAGSGEFNLFGFNANSRINGNIGVGQTINIVPRDGGSSFFASDASFTNNGTLNFNSDSIHDVTLQVAGTVSNAGTIRFGGTSTDNSTLRTLSAELNNLTGGVIDVAAQGTGTTIGQAGANHSNSGTIIVRNAGSKLNFVGATFANQADGVLKGIGEYSFASGMVLDNFGTIAPGLSPGFLSIDADVTLGSSSDLVIEIGGLIQGVDYDLLDVVQDLSLGGDLSVELFGGFESQIVGANSFTILTAGNLTGTFDGLADGAIFATSDGLGYFTINYQSNSVVLSNFSPVPEPGTCGLFLVALSTFVVRRKRVC